MPNQSVKIRSCTSASGTEMFVRPEITQIDQNEKIEFTNALDGNPLAKVSFYATAAKSAPLSDFCQGAMTNGYLEISGGASKDCIVTKYAKGGGVPFYYQVETTSGDPKNHQPLDPVIIIQPTVMQKDVLQATDPTLFVAGLIVGAVVAYFVGLMFR